ncbi:uncharacterized protein LOC107779463 isoform X2 [Nicotiana tabacum]|uniref:Uncharacterized protein LOC107779463 isoform X2 n=1 Tax=Nicotiana tabacum TaxID=4097 RepID=A0AC58S3Y7_TOBAC
MWVFFSGLIDAAATGGSNYVKRKCNKHYPRYQLLMYGVRHSPPIEESVGRARLASSVGATTVLLVHFCLQLNVESWFKCINDPESQ